MLLNKATLVERFGDFAVKMLKGVQTSMSRDSIGEICLLQSIGARGRGEDTALMVRATSKNLNC